MIVCTVVVSLVSPSPLAPLLVFLGAISLFIPLVFFFATRDCRLLPSLPVPLSCFFVSLAGLRMASVLGLFYSVLMATLVFSQKDVKDEINTV